MSAKKSKSQRAAYGVASTAFCLLGQWAAASASTEVGPTPANSVPFVKSVSCSSFAVVVPVTSGGPGLPPQPGLFSCTASYHVPAGIVANVHWFDARCAPASDAGNFSLNPVLAVAYEYSGTKLTDWYTPTFAPTLSPTISAIPVYGFTAKNPFEASGGTAITATIYVNALAQPADSCQIDLHGRSSQARE